MTSPALETPRLALRPCTWDDLDDLHRLWTDAQVRRWLWDDEVIPRDRAAQVIEESLGSFDAHGFGIWTLRDASGPEGAPLFGFAGLRFIEGTAEIELLYGLDPSRWGAGLATEAARRILAYAFGGLALPRIAGRVDTPNRASARVLEHLGMTLEGERPVNGLPTLHYTQKNERTGTLLE